MYGFSPVCMRMWLFSWWFRLKDLSHCGQLYFLTPLWVCLWLKKLLVLAKVFQHKSQINCFTIFKLSPPLPTGNLAWLILITKTDHSLFFNFHLKFIFLNLKIYEDMNCDIHLITYKCNVWWSEQLYFHQLKLTLQQNFRFS